MEKLFDDTLFVQKERPTQITKQQEEQMFIDLAKELIKQQYSESDEEDIVDDLKKLRFNDTGFNLAKELEDNGNCEYTFNGDFVDWLDELGYKKGRILSENVKLWVKVRNPKAKFEKGTCLKIVEAIYYKLKNDMVIYITGLKEEEAVYTVSEDKDRNGGYLVNYEKLESCCVINS